jgi:ferrous-iron efflux pump FieF
MTHDHSHSHVPTATPIRHTSQFSAEKKRRVLLTGAAAILVAGTLMGAKVFAFFHTGSAAILASVFDSGVDLMMSAMTFISLRYSLIPPDDTHRHGHGKIEGITALIQGALMMSLAGVLAYQAFIRLISGAPVEDPEIGIGVMVLSMVLSATLVKYQGHAVHTDHSLAIEADRGHYTSDIAMNAGTIAVLVLVPLTGLQFLDPLFAFGIASLMSYTALGIGRKSFAMLLDEEVEGPIKDRVAELITSDARVKNMHDLRITRSGMRLMMYFDMDLDGDLSLRDAHSVAIAAEDRILAEFPHAEIMIHLDPEHAPADRRHVYHSRMAE